MIVKLYTTNYICSADFCQEKISFISKKGFSDNDVALLKRNWVFYRNVDGNEDILCPLHKHRKRELNHDNPGS